MVVKAEQERVKTLIADTVSLLCKNGLHYTKEFCIEGLLGITLDRDEVFLVNIKELVKTEIQDASDSEQSGEEDLPSKSSGKRKRRRSKSKQTPDDVDDASNDTSASYAQPGSVDNSSEPPAKKSSIKEERTEEESDDEDLVFIKDEPGQDFSAFTSGDQSFSGAQSNNILGDLSQQGSLYATPTSLPAGSLASTSSWDPSQAAAAAVAFSQQNMSSQPNTPNASGQQQKNRQNQTLDQKRKDFNMSVIECEVCGAVFKTMTGFKAHQWDQHGLGKKGNIFTCDTCGKTFRGRARYNSHVALHNNKRLWKCDLCDKEYAHKKDLRHHKSAKHTAVGDHNKCKFCGKVFNWGNLSKHIQAVHSSGPLYTCIVHDVSFAHRGNLTRHFRTHKPDEAKDFEMIRVHQEDMAGEEATNDSETELKERDR